MWNIYTEYLVFLNKKNSDEYLCGIFRLNIWDFEIKKIMMNIYVEYFHQIFGTSEQKNNDEYLCAIFPPNIWDFWTKKIMMNIYVEYFHRIFGISEQKK